MGKQRSRVLDYAVYLLVRWVICLIQAVPYDAACRLAAGIARLAYHVDRRHRLVAEDNLRQAFPGRYRGQELDRQVRAVYRHFCNLIVDMAHLPRRLHASNWRRYLDLTEARPLVECLLSGRPLLMVTGHFGNWEVAGYGIGLLGFRAHAVARELDNPYLEDFLRRFRESTGQRLLSKKGDFDQMQTILDSGGLLGTLGDQDAGPRGLFVDFFGRPASTHKAMALLCVQHRVPLLVTGVAKVAEPMQHRVLACDLIRPDDYADRPDAIRAITQRLTTALERMIHQYPEQYFWLHRRWKHQPKARRAA